MMRKLVMAAAVAASAALAAPPPSLARHRGGAHGGGARGGVYRGGVYRGGGYRGGVYRGRRLSWRRYRGGVYRGGVYRGGYGVYGGRGRYWGGRCWGYGVGPCWRYNPVLWQLGLGLLLIRASAAGRSPAAPFSTQPRYSAQLIGVSKIFTESSCGSSGLTRSKIHTAIFSAVGFSSPSISLSK